MLCVLRKKNPFAETKGLLSQYYMKILIILIVSATATTAVSAFLVSATTAGAAAAIRFFLVATATAALLLGLGFVDDDLTTHHFGIVESGDRCLRFGVIFHFHEAETLAAPGHFVLDDFS